jgi:1-aminocyclopropane-1-carboxylate deaminase/D-cysteine desulfhydrase-like pyridoxal-dependent ACC family enzyme
VLAADTIAFLREIDGSTPDLTWEDLRLELREDWFEPGYGVVTPQTTDAVERAAEDGLALETTYTGKALSALLADARADRLAGEQVLFWDTYSSAPMPDAGPDETLPEVLREYVAECDRLFG